MTVYGHTTTRWQAAVVLLCLLATGNVLRGMVVCVGAHGHVAIEPAGHDHRADTVARDEEAPGVARYRTGRDAGHGPCADIPLSVGAFSGRLDAGAKINLSASVASPDQPLSRPDGDAAFQTFAPSDLPTHCLPLTGIVLQV